jgi:hypothetical protein
VASVKATYTPPTVVPPSLPVINGVVCDDVGNIGTTTGTTEMNLAPLQIPASGGFTILAGRYYVFNLVAECNASVANDEFAFIVRYGSVSGQIITKFRWQVANVTAFSDTKTFRRPWKCLTNDGGASFFLSVQRLAGTGTLSVDADINTAFWLEDGGSSQWRTS